jgi:hypothetical protein
MNIEGSARQRSIGDTDGVFTGEEIPYSTGWASFKETKDITFVYTTSRTRIPNTNPQQWNVVEKTKKLTETGYIVLTKAEIEALGYTDEQLATKVFTKWNIADVEPSVMLSSVALEIQPMGDTTNEFFPEVFINGKDDNTFDFSQLMTPWGYRVQDYYLKITGFNQGLKFEDMFTIDEDGRAVLKPGAPIYAPSENPLMLGVGGKFCEVKYENELPPIIRMIDGNYGFHKDEDTNTLIISSPAGFKRDIGFHIAFKPDTGKSDFYHVYMDIDTLEQRVKL